MKTGIFVLLIAFVLCGCPRGSYTSFKAPAYAGRQFETVLIYAEGMDLRGQQVTEMVMGKHFAVYGVKFYKAMDVLPPTSPMTAERVSAAIAENSVDSILVLTLSGTDISSSYVPQIASSNTTGNVSVVGNTAYFNSNTQTYGGGGFFVHRPVAHYRGALYDAKTWETAWISSGTLTGNAFNDFFDLSAKAGEITVKKLVSDGLYARQE